MTQNRARERGMVALILVILASALFFGRGELDFLGSPRLSAAFAEAGGLLPGDEVVVSGVRVGEVTDVSLSGPRVRVEFKIKNSDVRLGRMTSAAIVSQTVLGRRALELDPAGPGKLSAEIPLHRTTSPYAIEEAIADVTSKSQRLDIEQLAKSLDGTGRILEESAPDVRPFLTGIAEVGDLVNARDADLRRLLASSADVTGVLGSRELQIRTLIADASELLATVDHRKKSLERLFVDADRATDQLEGLINDNEQQLGPAFEELNQLLKLLREHRAEIIDGVHSAVPVLRNLGEVVASFPGFQTWIPNLVAPRQPAELNELIGGVSP